MTFKWIPFDFTALTTPQQDNMFVAWCKSVMNCVKELGFHGVLKFEEKGDSGMATERVIQGAQVWMTDAAGKVIGVNLLVAFNDMLANEPAKQGSEVLRNDPNWYAGSLQERAKDWAAFPPNPETYGVLPLTSDPDITV